MTSSRGLLARAAWIGLALLTPALGSVPAASAPRGSGTGLVTVLSRVRGGDLVEIEWKVTEPELEEMEILLSLDDGEHYPIWISPRLEESAGRLTWKVPNVAAARARLRVRFGDGRVERWLAHGAAFRIEPTAAPRTVSLPTEAYVWLGITSGSGFAPAAVLQSGTPTLTARARFAPAEIVPRHTAAARPDVWLGGSAPFLRTGVSSPSRTESFHAPRALPLRI